MTTETLGGVGVLVTRPVHLADDLIDAITDAGGKALRFPVIDILPRPGEAVARDLHAMPEPDIVIFVSRNAVVHGIGAVRGSKTAVAAIGPATARALDAAGRPPDILPRQGFDSEHLLAEPALQDVTGKCIRIVRGNGGRELLEQTLRDRGATVDNLAVYRRARHRFDDEELAGLAQRLRSGGIRFVTAMSVATLENLLELLPDPRRNSLDGARLVTPSERVIQTALERMPQVRSLLATGPGASHMVAAMLSSLDPQTDDAHD